MFIRYTGVKGFKRCLDLRDLKDGQIRQIRNENIRGVLNAYSMVERMEEYRRRWKEDIDGT